MSLGNILKNFIIEIQPYHLFRLMYLIQGLKKKKVNLASFFDNMDQSFDVFNSNSLHLNSRKFVISDNSDIIDL